MNTPTHKISTCLWFDNQAEEAAKFYVSVFKNAKMINASPYQTDTPSKKQEGNVMTVDFQIEDYHFTGLNGGPMFKPNPSISFFVNFDPSRDKNTVENLEILWKQLTE